MIDAQKPEQAGRRRRASIAAYGVVPIAVAVAIAAGSLAGCGDGSTVTGLRSSGPDALQVNEIVVDPDRQGIAYVAGSSRAREGVFATRDGGKTWLPIGPNADREARAVAVDPNDPRILFAVSWNYDLVTYALYRSIDRGRNWTRLRLGDGNGNVLSVTVDPTRQGVVYAASVGSVIRSTDAGESWQRADQGLEASGDSGPAQIERIVASAGRPRMIYAVAQPGLFVSRDAGRHWRRTSRWRPEASLAPSQSVAVDAHGTGMYAVDGGSLASSIDDGRTWKSLGITAAGADLGAAAIHAVAVDPSRRHTLYVSLTDHIDYRSWVLKSTTGGASWVVVAEASGRSSTGDTPYGFEWLAVDRTGSPVYVGTHGDGVLLCDTCGSITSP